MGRQTGGWRGTDRAFRAVHVADHVPIAGRGSSRDSSGSALAIPAVSGPSPEAGPLGSSQRSRHSYVILKPGDAV